MFKAQTPKIAQARKRMLFGWFLLLTGVLPLTFVQCKKSTAPGNSAPVIFSLKSSEQSVNFLDNVTIRATVKDADGDSIFFQWLSDQGRFTFTSLDSAIWKAPEITGSVRIALQVNDVFNAFDVDSVIVNVQNQAPVISSLDASQTNVLVGNIVTLSVVASDPDGGSVTYSWQADKGEFVGNVTESAVTWRASTSVSVVTITVSVTDSDGGTTTKDVTINVFQELGSLWVSDSFNDEIVKLSSNGTQLFRISGFSRPQGLALDITDRSLWIADWGGNRIVKYTDNGNLLFEITGFDRPTDIAVQANGNVWVTTMGDSIQVFEISHDGTVLRKLLGFSDPQSIDVNRLNGEIWITDTGNDRIVNLNSQVPGGYNLDSVAVVPVRYDVQYINYTNPEALEVDQATGNCWVADTGNHRVVRINASDRTEFIIAGFLNPRGLAVDKLDGSCWVANTWDNEVVKIFSDVFDLPLETSLPYNYNIDTNLGFHFVIPGFIQPWAIDINVVDNIVWFADIFRLVKVSDLGIDYSIIKEFTNFNAPKSLTVNPGSSYK